MTAAVGVAGLHDEGSEATPEKERDPGTAEASGQVECAR